MKSEIPLWVVACLGKSVVLTREFVGPCETYGVGREGRLVGILGDEEAGFHALVALDAHDPTYWENFTFSEIRAASGDVKFSLDLNGPEGGSISF
jgi:hypothetical protein